ncbi:hypothetical protein UCRPC4_g01693 [Phaeomoniella chlamydospora]|uniref:Uncharacterized protein n=1 Tax=Phaeomoniella chlamydospora TaxID=158046 RepID=A0A0G2ES89_PHACM|nr:hypothetical protein UCRPC4_g01693 [Phaeomoniella chlamydospora]
MSIFSKVKIAKKAADEKKAHDSQQKPPVEPYRHIPTHAMTDALGGAPTGRNAADKAAIRAAHLKRQSTMSRQNNPSPGHSPAASTSSRESYIELPFATQSQQPPIIATTTTDEEQFSKPATAREIGEAPRLLNPATSNAAKGTTTTTDVSPSVLQPPTKRRRFGIRFSGSKSSIIAAH